MSGNKYKYVVITDPCQIFDEGFGPDKGKKRLGGYATDFLFARKDPLTGPSRHDNLVVGLELPEAVEDQYDATGHFVGVPVFRKYEIVVVDKDYGREVIYPGRKPSKWFISYEVYDTFEEALKRALELEEAEYNVDRG